MNQEALAKLLHEKFTAWVNADFGKGITDSKARHRLTSYNQPWERLSEDHRAMFRGLAGEIVAMSDKSQDVESMQRKRKKTKTED